MERIIITVLILAGAYYLLKPTETKENKTINQSTQTYFSPEIGKPTSPEIGKTEEALLEELINQIKELNQIL